MKVLKALTFLGWPLLLLPTVLIYLGFALNSICTVANNGRMPVRTSFCSKYHDDDTDPIHFCADKDTKLVWLGDILTSDESISSVGDHVIEIGERVSSENKILWMLIGGVCFIRRKNFWVG